MAESIDDLRQKAATAHRILAMTGSMNDSTGHVFVRIPGSEEMLARGRDAKETSPRYCSAAAMHKVDFQASKSEDWGDWAPPPERYIGTEILKLRPEVNCVIHAHPPAQVLCSNIGVPLQPIVGSQNWGGTLLAAKGVPVFPRGLLIHTAELGRLMAAVMSSKDVLLLQHHGNVVTGRTIEEATTRAIAIENLARLCWQIRLTGKTPPNIPFEDFEDNAEMSLRPRPLGGGANWQWRYYEQMLERDGRINADIDWS